MAARSVQVCQNRTCRRQGAAAVLAAFQTQMVPGVQVEGCGCLGQCGNGPMVFVIPDQVWYSRVHSAEVPTIVQGHLRDGRPVTVMLYRKFHPDEPVSSTDGHGSKREHR